MRIAVMQLRNESFFLPGCLAHLRPYVDGIVALDDGSTDETGNILRKEPKVIEVLRNPVRDRSSSDWDEPGNRTRLLEAAVRQGARWVVCCDADERFELAFLRDLPGICAKAEREKKILIPICLRELYDSPLQFRVDGIWRKKWQIRVFSPPPTLELSGGKKLHGAWVPEAFRKPEHMLGQPLYNLYHLKMIRAEDRTARRRWHEQLDPSLAFQPMGYGYLDDDAGAACLRIPEGMQYDLSTVPEPLLRHRGPCALP